MSTPFLDVIRAVRLRETENHSDPKGRIFCVTKRCPPFGRVGFCFAKVPQLEHVHFDAQKHTVSYVLIKHNITYLYLPLRENAENP